MAQKYQWFDWGPDQNGLEFAVEGSPDGLTFTEAKRQLLRSLMATKLAYQVCINNVRVMTKDDVE